MIEPKSLLNCFLKNSISFISGVPDSILSGFISYLNYNKHRFQHRISVNEGGAVALGIAYHLSTKKIPLIYMQNSGLPHALNPLLSMADKKIYKIPMILLIGRRGAPGFKKDEPQHYITGPITENLLKVSGIYYEILSDKNYKASIKKLVIKARKKSCPVALIVNPGFIKKLNYSKKNRKNILNRFECIQEIVKIAKKNKIIATTGNSSRELFFINETNKKKHQNSFYCIGAMGHANLIGSELSFQTKKKIIILDGDGALQMHMGNASIIGNYNKIDIIHFLFVNGVHESTGGHLLANNKIDYKNFFLACGYDHVINLNKIEQISSIVKEKKGKIAVIVNILSKTVENLPRPNKSPEFFKKLFMKNLKKYK